MARRKEDRAGQSAPKPAPAAEEKAPKAHQVAQPPAPKGKARPGGEEKAAPPAMDAAPKDVAAKGKPVPPVDEKPAAAKPAPPDEKPAAARPAAPKAASLAHEAVESATAAARATGRDAAAEKDKNYASAVVYLGNEAGCAAPFLGMLCAQLDGRFAHYELVFVNDASRDGTEAEVRAFLDQLDEVPPVTMIHLSLRQGLELAMNAGLDMAVGDFVYEFDSMKMPYPAEMVLGAYDACLAGSDIVSVAPQKNRRLSSRLFYRLFNAHSGSPYALRTDAFRLLSRRAVNRVHAISPSLPYRKAAYAASGLRLQTLLYQGSAGGETEQMRASRAVDSLALYTNVASRFSITIAVVMLVLMVAALAYTLLVNFTQLVPDVAPGWTTTMLMLTGGFFAVFLLLAFVLKYLSLLVELIFRKQTYLVESIEKIK